MSMRFSAGGPILNLDPTVGGTITRALEASYLTSANTLAWAGANVRRVPYTGGVQIEGGRTNDLLWSEAPSNAAWTKGGGASVAASGVAAPDGAFDVETVTFTASATDRVTQPAQTIPANAAQGVFTIWLRSDVAKTVDLRMLQKDGATYGASVPCVLTTAWQRFELNQAVGAGASAPVLGVWNADALATGYQHWGAMFECSAALCQFPSSYIRTGAATVARPTDTFSYSAAGQYPESFRTRGLRVRYAAECTSTEMGGSTHHVLFATSNSDLLYLQVIAGVVRAVLYGGGVLLATSAPLTFSREQLLVVDALPNVGAVTVSGATTGNGTTGTAAGTLVAATMIFGRYYSTDAYQAFGRFVAIEGL